MGFKTQVKTRGVAPANAIVERITSTECVLRCVLLFDVNAPIEFEAHLPNRPPFAVKGTIRSRVSVPPRFEYTIALQPQQNEAPAAAAEVRPEELGRKHQRFNAEFSLQYRTAKEGFRRAKGRNVSTGGLLMTCDESLIEGMFLELHFVLPSEVLAVYGFNKGSKLRQPFDDIVVQARVVHHRPLGSDVSAYGVNFVGLNKHDREQITRFVHATGRVKVRQIP